MIKQLKNGLIHGFGIMLMVGIVGGAYAALSSLKVNDADTLTSSIWNNLVDHSVPSTAVMAFYTTSCPTGWSPADGTNSTPDLRGTFIRGMNGDANSRDVARTLGNYQTDSYMSHLHSVNPPSTSTSTNGNHTHKVRIDNNTSGRGAEDNNENQAGFAMNTDAAGDHTHTVDIAAFNSASAGGTETRPKNVALLYCVKD